MLVVTITLHWPSAVGSLANQQASGNKSEGQPAAVDIQLHTNEQMSTNKEIHERTEDVAAMKTLVVSVEHKSKKGNIHLEP
jgi:hypothetical protein